jgi:hypothetical protein
MEQDKADLIRKGYEIIRSVAPYNLLDMGECIEVGKYGIGVLGGKSPKTTPVEVMYEYERKKTLELWERVQKGWTDMPMATK